MDFTNIFCISEQCKGNNTKMQGSGASLGGRVSLVSVCCPVCSTKLLIVPMNDKYEYSVSATTEEDRINERVRKVKEESDLKLAQTIIGIRESAGV